MDLVTIAPFVVAVAAVGIGAVAVRIVNRRSQRSDDTYTRNARRVVTTGTKDAYTLLQEAKARHGADSVEVRLLRQSLNTHYGKIGRQKPYADMTGSRTTSVGDIDSPEESLRRHEQHHTDGLPLYSGGYVPADHGRHVSGDSFGGERESYSSGHSFGGGSYSSGDSYGGSSDSGSSSSDSSSSSSD